MEDNHTSGNKESEVYCQYITFSGICHSANDLLNWIALSMQFSQRN